MTSDEIFPTELTNRSFQASNGEFGWNREDACLVVSILARRQLAILGGELWWLPDGTTAWTGLIPQRHGPAGVYPWETVRMKGEAWAAYVERCASESLQSIARWPAPDDLPADLQGRILYNLTWVAETEYFSNSADAI